MELLAAAPTRIKEIWIERQRELPQLREQAAQLGITVTDVSRERMEEEVGEGLARGVIARAAPPLRGELNELYEATSQPEILVALDGVNDPQNFGAILRSAEFFGARGVLWATDRAAPLSPLAVRASAGASERVRLYESANLVQALAELKREGWWIAGTVVDDNPVPWGQFLQADPPTRLILVMGNEQQGLRRLTRDRCDFLVTLPRSGELGSLNVSAATAASLALWHALRPDELDAHD